MGEPSASDRSGDSGGRVLPTEALLELAALYVMAPLPLWSQFQEAVGDPVRPDSSPSLDDHDLAEVIAAGQALTRFGFTLGPAPKIHVSPPFDSQHLTVTFLRGVDKITLAVIQHGVFVAFQNTDADDSEDEARQRPGTFGAFPVRPGVEAGVGATMRRVVEWFIDFAGGALSVQPLPVDDIRTRCDAFALAEQRAVHERFYRARADVAWSEGRHRSVVEHYEALDRFGALTSDEQSRLDASRRAIERSNADHVQATDTLDAIVAEINRTRAVLDDAFDRRSEPGGMSRWEDVAYAARDAITKFEDHVSRLEHGLRAPNPASIDAAIEFLEIDPWCFRSGYAKGRLMRRLRRIDHSPDHAARLVRVVLHVVDRGGRMEFRDATRLGRELGGAEIRNGLRERLHGSDRDIARRALLALLDLRRPRLTQDDLVVARRLVLDELHRQSSEPNAYWWPDWPERLATMVASPEWIATLLDEIRSNGPYRQAALVVVARQSSTSASDDDLDLLRRLLVDVVRNGGDERGLEAMARLVDSPALRVELEGFFNASDEEVQRRAWWARNAIRRAHESG